MQNKHYSRRNHRSLAHSISKKTKSIISIKHCGQPYYPSFFPRPQLLVRHLHPFQQHLSQQKDPNCMLPKPPGRGEVPAARASATTPAVRECSRQRPCALRVWIHRLLGGVERSAGPGGNARRRSSLLKLSSPRRRVPRAVNPSRRWLGTEPGPEEKTFITNVNFLSTPLKTSGGKRFVCVSTCMLWQRWVRPHLQVWQGPDQLSSPGKSRRRGTRMPRLPLSGRQEAKRERVRETLFLRTRHFLLAPPTASFQFSLRLETGGGGVPQVLRQLVGACAARAFSGAGQSRATR